MKVLFHPLSQLVHMFLFFSSIVSIAQTNEWYTGPIIDMHLHAKSEASAKNRPCFPQPCLGEPTVAKSAGELKPLTLAAMARNNVVLGVISGEVLDDVLSWTEGDERFLTGIMLNHPDDIDLTKVKDLFTSGKAQILGEVGPAYYGIPIDDPKLDPFFAMAHELDIPVLIHLLGIGGGPEYHPKLGNPLNLVPVLLKYPGLRVYLENAGWPFSDEAIALMYQYPNVYADVSTIIHMLPRKVVLDHISKLIDHGLGKRIMYGSDDMIWPEVIDVTIEVIQTAAFLSLEQKADIFYHNAARFLRLSDEQIARHHESKR